MAISSTELQALLVVLLICAAGFNGAQARVGVNWGDIARHPLEPKIVVQLLQSNNITRVKLFDVKPYVVEALAGTGIEVMIGAPNSLLPQLAAEGKDGETAANDWVVQNLTRYLERNDGGVKIKYVAVGNEPFFGENNFSYGHLALPALLNIQRAIKAAGLEKVVAATIPMSADTLDESEALPDPSSGAFRPDIAGIMNDIVASYNRTGAPFCINIYPFINVVFVTDFPEEYAFFGTHNLTDAGSNLTYHNVFDATFDRVVAALGKVGSPDLPIMVGEVGWPTDGNKDAITTNAQKFNNELLAHVGKKSGTPLRPNVDFKVYLFSLLDEDMKDLLNGAAPYERHWGVFYNDGTPKYPIDFSGSGDPKAWPKSAVGVKHMANKFCVVNTSISPDPVLLGQKMDYACSMSDCTALQVGASCSNLTTTMKASYAFNNYYQFHNQADLACDFQGYGTVTTENPSAGQCKFTLGLASSGCNRNLEKAKATGFLVVVISLIFSF